MRVDDMALADRARRKAQQLVHNVDRLMGEADDERANYALYEYLKDAGYSFLGIAAEVHGDD